MSQQTRQGALVPIDQQVVFYAAEVAKAKERLQRAVSSAQMRPAVMEHILKNMRAVLQTLRQAEAEENAP